MLTLLLLWVAYFFRDPERTGPRGDRLVVSRIRLASEHTAIDGSGEFSSLSARRGVFSATANPLDLDELLTIASGFSGSTPRSGSAAAGAQGSVARPAPLEVRFRLEAPRGRVLGIDFTNLVPTMRRHARRHRAGAVRGGGCSTARSTGD